MTTLQQQFEQARQLFRQYSPSGMRGFAREWKNFVKRSKNPLPNEIKFDISEVTPLLLPAVQNQIPWRAKDGRLWKNFQTWINHGCWEEEGPIAKTTVIKQDRCAMCGSTNVSGTYRHRWHCPRCLKQVRGW